MGERVYPKGIDMSKLGKIRKSLKSKLDGQRESLRAAREYNQSVLSEKMYYQNKSDLQGSVLKQPLTMVAIEDSRDKLLRNILQEMVENASVEVLDPILDREGGNDFIIQINIPSLHISRRFMRSLPELNPEGVTEESVVKTINIDLFKKYGR